MACKWIFRSRTLRKLQPIVLFCQTNYFENRTNLGEIAQEKAPILHDKHFVENFWLLPVNFGVFEAWKMLVQDTAFKKADGYPLRNV